jgi:hypothetical protein
MSGPCLAADRLQRNTAYATAMAAAAAEIFTQAHQDMAA